MRPLAVVETDPVIDDPLGFETVIDFVQIDCLLLQRSPEPLDEDVVQIATCPSIEILISALAKVVIQPAPVYWLP